MDAIFTELLKIMPLGQAAGLILLIFILKVLLQSKDKLNDVVGVTTALKEEMERHQEQDDRQFDEVKESIRDVHKRVDAKGRTH